jgi:Domain of unknown function (DUF4148)
MVMPKTPKTPGPRPAGSQRSPTPPVQPYFFLELIMNTTRLVALSILSATAAFSGLAQADTLTRAEVKAEAREAIRTGDVIDFETGLKLNQLFPGAYPKQVAIKTVASRPAPAAVFQPIGDIEMDAINQRNAEAIARAQAKDSQFAGKR